MYKVLFFDLDGTLLDTSIDIHQTLNSCLKNNGLPEITLEKTLSYVGNGARKLIERAVGEVYNSKFEAVFAEYAEKFAACGNKFTNLYDGEDLFLKRVKQNGIKTAIITNKPQNATEKVAAQYLEAYGFEIVYGNSERHSLKPDPSAVLEIISLFNAEKKDCVFIGDGETDVETAKNAGIDCISVLWGFRTKQQLLSAGADKFASSYYELTELIFK